jgi:F-type H+-transporting ATPase subunit b
MLIDWFTVSVQIVNFLILVALLKHFLYAPILRAMDERERTIAARLDDAATAKQEAEAKAAILSREQEEFALTRNQLELEAHQEIERWKDESLERIKDEIKAQRANWQQNLVDEQETFLQKLKIQISRQVFLVAQKALADLADSSLESRLLETFLKKVEQEPGDPLEKSDLNTKTLQVLTGFPLNNQQKETLRSKLGLTFSSFNDVNFSDDETLGLGIRLLANDRKWEWNLSRYMQDIEKEIIQSMNVITRKSE